MSIDIRDLLGGIPDSGPIPEDTVEEEPLKAQVEDRIRDLQAKVRSEAIHQFDWNGMGVTDDAEQVSLMLEAEARAIWDVTDSPMDFFLVVLHVGARLAAHPETVKLAEQRMAGEWKDAADAAVKRIVAGRDASKKRFDEQARAFLERTADA